MNIACWNCGGIKSNFVYIKELLESVVVLALSEHWLYEDEQCFLDNLQLDFLYYAKVSERNYINTRWRRGQRGVAIVWRN